jgi:hypothetical protein
MKYWSPSFRYVIGLYRPELENSFDINFSSNSQLILLYAILILLVWLAFRKILFWPIDSQVI